MVHELRTSLFSSLIDSEYPPCDECPSHGDHEVCMTTHAICGDGKFIMHDDPPSPVIVWPKCPRQYEATWSTSPHISKIDDLVNSENMSFLNLCSSFSPREYMEWNFERGEHKRAILAGADFLFREYFKIRDLPRVLQEIKISKEAEAKRGKS